MPKPKDISMEQKQDLLKRFERLGVQWDLNDDQLHMANQIIYMREKPTVPTNLVADQEVLYKRALCVVTKADCRHVYNICYSNSLYTKERVRHTLYL